MNMFSKYLLEVLSMGLLYLGHRSIGHFLHTVKLVLFIS
jgi:hypothetical protein